MFLSRSFLLESQSKAEIIYTVTSARIYTSQYLGKTAQCSSFSEIFTQENLWALVQCACFKASKTAVLLSNPSQR